MKPLRRNNGNQHLHRKSLEYRNAIKRKIPCLPHYSESRRVWSVRDYFNTSPSPFLSSSGRPSAPGCGPFAPASRPSELVVATALHQSLPEFLLNAPLTNIFAKFVMERQDVRKMEAFRLAS